MEKVSIDKIRFFRVEQSYAVKSGKWYFEFEAVTGGDMRVGWARPGCRPDIELGADDQAFVFEGSKVSTSLCILIYEQARQRTYSIGFLCVLQINYWNIFDLYKDISELCFTLDSICISILVIEIVLTKVCWFISIFLGYTQLSKEFCRKHKQNTAFTSFFFISGVLQK